VCAQLIPVDQNEDSIFISSAPTMTFLYPAKDAKATLIFLPGGFGHVGIKPTTPANAPFFTRYHFNLMLKRLTNADDSSGLFNVVIFDNPTVLAQATKYTYPSSRRSLDHLVRVDSVVNHYQKLLGKPIWLMGHSNGAASITEYYKKLQKDNKQTAISGMVYSGSIHGPDFGPNTLLPVLFLHHEKDGCDAATWQQAQKVFQKLIANGNTKSEFSFVKGGEIEPKDPCLSGLHMYFGAEKEAADLIDQFGKKHFQ
jgi:pimeloyl-ACP methyl ester carboxylesterase